MDFFNKYWEVFAAGENPPQLALIEKAYFENKRPLYFGDTMDLETKITNILRGRGIDKAHYNDIAPEHLILIDLPEYYDLEKK